MTRELDLAALRLLVLIDELGSLGASGRALGVTQPAASATLRALEARWQVRLAVRSRRGTLLTDDGRTVVAWARDLLHQADAVRAGLDSLSAEHASEGLGLRVAASLTVAEFVMPRWIGELRARAPHVRLRLNVVNSHVVASRVRSGDCAIGFVETSVIAGDMARAVVGHDRLVLVVAAAHPWARRSTPLTSGQLVAAEYVVREEGSGTRATFERALGAVPRVAMVATSTAAMIGAVLAGVGPAVVTPYAVRGALETGDLVEVGHELDLDRPLTAIWRAGEPLEPSAARLVSIARRDIASRR